MNKSELKAAFINVKAIGAKYIGVKKEFKDNSFGCWQEIVIHIREDFDNKFNYYVYSYTDDLVSLCPEKNETIRITGVAYGNTFEDIEYQLLSVGTGWKKPISDAIDKSYNKMIAETPPQSEEEKVRCETMKEAIKGMFLNASRSKAEAKFITENIEKYEEIFDICMNGDDMEFRKGLMELQRMQNEHILKEEDDSCRS